MKFSVVEFLTVVALALAVASSGIFVQPVLKNPGAKVILPEQVTADETGACPLWWMYNGSSCECGNDLTGIVRCDSDLSLKTCYCMTYSEQLREVLVSYCLYTCSVDIHYEYVQLTATNITAAELNDNVCKLYRRTGLMCGKCVDDYAPAVYSYSLACVECRHYKYNILKYIAVAYIPLTIFYVAVIMFRIPINSGAMIAYVTLNQMVASPGLITFYSARFERHSIKYANIFLVLCTFWNFDFFRSLYQPFCLHPKLRTVDIISLDYILGVYPLLLTVVTYLFVQLHGRSRLFTLICMPVYKCMYRFRRVWDIKESLVKAFATFLVLSYVKIMNVSVELLTPAHGYYNISGKTVDRMYLFSNGSMEYFGEDHIPYAVMAIIMSILFNIIPLILLCAYPCRCCHKLLNLFPFRHDILHTFMDTLQGEFKEQPRDCRYFAGLYIALRMVNLILYAYIKSPVYFLWAACVLVFFVVLLAVMKPYKYSCYNSLDPWLFLMVIVVYISISIRFESLYITPKEAMHTNTLLKVIILLAMYSFSIYGVILLVYQLFPSWKVKQFIAYMKHLFKHRQELEESLNFQRNEYNRLS